MRQGRLKRKTLDTCVNLAYPILIRTAKRGETIPHSKLLRLMGGKPGTRHISEVLNRIAKLEREARRPKLSAVAVHTRPRVVGGGFFTLPDTPPELVRTGPEERQNPKLSATEYDYWRQQLTSVYKYWQSRHPRTLKRATDDER